jgi:myo-inositol-1(or 4)-monophosphatase
MKTALQMTQADARDVAVRLAQEAGQLLLARFGSQRDARVKGHSSDVVTEIDIASETLIVRELRRLYPEDAIIAEESGCSAGRSEFTWVVDPLDGTSNFVAGVPWFGVMIALLRGVEPVVGVMHLPVSGELYMAQRGQGAYRDGARISVTPERNLGNVLWAYGIDGGSDGEGRRHEATWLGALASSVRNVRTTNSLIDPAYTADGRFGGMINRRTKLWDIAAASLIVREAGGAYTDTSGRALVFDLSAQGYERDYAVLAGAPALHADVVRLLADAAARNGESATVT